jgi:hypothetical protein
MADMDYTYTFTACKHCGRHIMVERILFGVSHTAAVYGTCVKCIKQWGLHPEFVKQNPDLAHIILTRINKLVEEDQNEMGV